MVVAGLGACLTLACGAAQGIDVSRWAFGSASRDTVLKDLQLLFPGSTVISRDGNIVVEKARVDGGTFAVRAGFGGSDEKERVLSTLTIEGDLPKDGKLSVMDGFARMDRATEDYMKNAVEADVIRKDGHISITFRAVPAPAAPPRAAGEDTLEWLLILMSFGCLALFLRGKARGYAASRSSNRGSNPNAAPDGIAPQVHEDGVQVNPANGLPMLGAFDTHGNTYGSNTNDSFNNHT
jgi:hypothetical protein